MNNIITQIQAYDLASLKKIIDLYEIGVLEISDDTVREIEYEILAQEEESYQQHA